MKQLRHTGNTCLVNWTCFTAFDITTEDMAFILSIFPSARRATGSCYVSIPMAEWKAAYKVFEVALQIMGLHIEYEPDCFDQLPAKAREWCKATPLESVFQHDNNTGLVHRVV